MQGRQERDTRNEKERESFVDIVQDDRKERADCLPDREEAASRADRCSASV